MCVSALTSNSHTLGCTVYCAGATVIVTGSCWRCSDRIFRHALQAVGENSCTVNEIPGVNALVPAGPAYELCGKSSPTHRRPYRMSKGKHGTHCYCEDKYKNVNPRLLPSDNAVLAASDSLEIHLTFFVCVHTCEQRVGEAYLITIITANPTRSCSLALWHNLATLGHNACTQICHP